MFSWGNIEEVEGYSKAKSLSDFVESVKKNHGYYIARYEAGRGESDKPVSKSGGMPWTQITQSKASEVSQMMYEENDNCTSDLVNSYAWDTAIVYIQAMGNTNYANANRGSHHEKLETGKAGDEKCHINDMAGNPCEYTTEYSTFEDGDTSPTTYRGGVYTYDYDYTSYRHYHQVIGNINIGFRTILYLW